MGWRCVIWFIDSVQHRSGQVSNSFGNVVECRSDRTQPTVRPLLCDRDPRDPHGVHAYQAFVVELEELEGVPDDVLAEELEFDC